MDATDLRSLPKVDLHRHLEGAIRLSTIIDLAREHEVTLPAATPEDLAPHALITRPVASLEEALAAFGYAQGSFMSYAAVRRIAREAVEDLAAENVRLAELRFSPGFMCAPAGLDWDRAMEEVLAGVEEARAAGSDVAVGLISIFSRDYPETAEPTIGFTLRWRDHLVGFDIAGPEVGYPPELYVDLVRPLQDAGIHVTTHYGESGPPDYPRRAVELLRTERLGHGLSVAWDPAVTELVVDRGTTLEMCPTSNWLTHGVADVSEHPVRELLRGGARATLNTDDPSLFGIDLTHEYELARDRIGFTADDFRAAVRNSLEASFLPDGVKEDVRRRHFAWAD